MSKCALNQVLKPLTAKRFPNVRALTTCACLVIVEDSMYSMPGYLNIRAMQETPVAACVDWLKPAADGTKQFVAYGASLASNTNILNAKFSMFFKNDSPSG